MAKRQNRGKLEETTRRFKRRAQRQDAAVLAIVLREWNRLLAKLLVKTERLKEAGTSEAAAARAEALAKEAGEQVEALNEKLCPVIEKGQEAAIETGIEQAETVLAEAGVPASSMVRVNKDAFETMIGMTQDGSPLREVLDKGAGYSIKEAVILPHENFFRGDPEEYRTGVSGAPAGKFSHFPGGLKRRHRPGKEPGGDRPGDGEAGLQQPEARHAGGAHRGHASLPDIHQGDIRSKRCGEGHLVRFGELRHLRRLLVHGRPGLRSLTPAKLFSLGTPKSMGEHIRGPRRKIFSSFRWG